MDLHCPLECPTCPLGEPDKLNTKLPAYALQDGRFARAAAAYFGIPLLLSFIGAAVFANGQTEQFLGAVAGLALGMLLAVWLSKKPISANRDKP